MNANFVINKACKEQVTKFIKTKFGAMTQQHSSKIFEKNLQSVRIIYVL